MAELLQAGEDFVTEGERRAAEELEKLPSNWTVIANKVLPWSATRSYEIDFIVIGEHGVYAIDEKGWRGRIHGSDQSWVREGGASEHSPLNKIDFVAKVLRGYLNEKIAGFRDIPGHPVTGLVLLTSVANRPNLSDARASRQIMMLDDAVTSLRRLDADQGDLAVGSLRQRIVACLLDLSHRPKIPRSINDYTVLDTRPGPSGSLLAHARHAVGGERLLTLHRISPAERNHSEAYLRDYRALTALRDTRTVPEVHDPFVWSEDFIVVPSELPSGIPLSELATGSSQADVQREIEVAVSAFGALARIHAAGIIHRSISPAAVYVEWKDGVPHIQFSGFYAARLGEQTIAPRLDEERAALRVEDPYAAPEIAVGYGLAEPVSDTYSLALVFMERLSGASIASAVSADGPVRVPMALDDWPRIPPDVAGSLIEFFQAALTQGPAAPPGSPSAIRLSATDCAEWLSAIARQMRTDGAIEDGDLLDGRYRVVRTLGEGAFARTFLAEDTELDGLFALKQFLRPGNLDEMRQARQEFGTLRSISNRHLPRVYDVYPPTNEVHVKLDYVPGSPLSDIMSEYHGNLERCRRLAGDLLDALHALEAHSLLHRDLKPENVIVRQDTGDAVLIDFGVATPVGASSPLAGSPAFVPPEGLHAEQPPPSSDRYALAVLLFRALFDRDPFGEGAGRRPIDNIAAVSTDHEAFARALIPALALDPSERYLSAAEFRIALLGSSAVSVSPATIALEERLNPWVSDLRRLFRNSQYGNADNRGLDTPFAHSTYVRTALDVRLLPAILQRKPRAVFLSGNPGDGKTAFLEQVKAEVSIRGQRIAEDESGWEWQLDGHTFRACYDASESHAGRSADEQLRRRLRGLEGNIAPTAELTVLVAINDGRLDQALDAFSSEFSWLAIEARKAGSIWSHEPYGVWLIDLKQRACMSLQPDHSKDSVLRRMLDALTSEDHWKICDGCIAQQNCPLYGNALTLRDPHRQGPPAQLERALLLTHLRGWRHLTIRDLRSGLAYLLTHDADCAQVHGATKNALPAAEYWRTGFTTESNVDVMLGELRPFDPARFARPRLERFFHVHDSAADAQLRATLFVNGRDLPPKDDSPSSAWLEDVKRRLYFEGNSSTTTAITDEMLPYEHADAFVDALRGDNDRTGILRRLLQGIGRSDGIPARVLGQGLCLKVAHSEANRLTVYKQFPATEFSLDTVRPPSDEFIEAIPQLLELHHTRSGATLQVPLDLFELLMNLAEGLDPASAEYRPLVEDLAPFKSRVQLSSSHELMLLESGRQPYLLAQREGRIRLVAPDWKRDAAEFEART